VYRIDHDPGRHDDRAIALALAVHRLTEEQAAPMDFGVGLGEVLREFWAPSGWRL
jgi:hypothetical protein